MDSEFIYWPHLTPVGVKVEEVSGCNGRSGHLWREMALQIYCEHGPDGFREIGHFPDGAPFIFGLTARISITHTSHLLAVAMLPKTPEADLGIFNTRSAMGIDAERLDREQVIKVRSKFLSSREQELIPEKDLEKNIIAWTAKEALYKAAMTPGLDFSEDIELLSLPEIDRHMNQKNFPAPVLGKAKIHLPDDSGNKKAYEMTLYSYESDDCCVTIAISPKAAKFGKI